MKILLKTPRSTPVALYELVKEEFCAQSSPYRPAHMRYIFKFFHGSGDNGQTIIYNLASEKFVPFLSILNHQEEKIKNYSDDDYIITNTDEELDIAKLEVDLNSF